MSMNQVQADFEDNLDAEIGRRVHQLMWDQHLTQTAFATLAGMDQSGVAKRLRGKLGWSAKQVRDAARALRTSAAYLLGETENPHQFPGGGDSVGPAGIEPTTSTVEAQRLAPVTPLFTRAA